VHPVGVTLGHGVRIGENVTLASGVVLAARYYDAQEGDQQGFATIEDGAVLGAHAVVVGAVTVGRNAMVGANSVVLSDVPENAVVMGVPARRVGTREGVQEQA
jgi:serine O-acetyltransferase